MTRDELQARCMRVPFFRYLDFTIERADEAGVLAAMTQCDRHVGNPVLGAFHGGITASFMEAIASAAVWRHGTEAAPKPINLTVDYLRPALAGVLHARAGVGRLGRRMASVETLAWQEEEARPVARGLFHFLVV